MSVPAAVQIPGVVEPRPAGPRAPGSTRQLHAPRVRRLARDLGLELAGLHGSGPWGRLTTEDVRALARDSDPPPPAPESQRQVLQVGYEVDVTSLLRAGSNGHELLEACVLQLTDRALSDAGGTRPRLLVRRADGSLVDPDSPRELTLDALARTLRERPSIAATEVASEATRQLHVSVSRAGGPLTRTPHLAGSEVAVLTVGAPRLVPTAVEHEGRGALAFRSVALLTLTYRDGWMPESSTDRVVKAVVDGLSPGAAAL